MFSVIIPAHNESIVISHCLDALFSEPPLNEEMEVIVVCNGCKDETAEIASSYCEVTVIEISQASKISALNAGDDLANFFPRAYVDADVCVTGRALQEACKSLKVSDICVAAPKLQVDFSRSNFGVKSFYKIWMQLPYFTMGEMVGSGVYILSAEGRSRFDYFPQVIADDGFVRALFKSYERKMCQNSHFKIFAPRFMSELVRIKARARFGNMEITQKYPNLKIGGENKSKDLLKLLTKNPFLIFSLLIYCIIQLQTLWKAMERLRLADYDTWERDNSSRCAR